MYRRDATQIATLLPDMTDKQYLGEIGHVVGPVYSYAYPGGPNQMSANLQIPPTSRPSALDPGRIVKLYRGGSEIWDGKLDEPSIGQSGWDISAHGAGTFGAEFAAYYTAWDQNNAVNWAIANEGLRWVNPGIPSGVWLSEQPDNTSEMIDAMLNTMTIKAGYGWYVGRRNVLKVDVLPTTPTRILIANEPVGRNLFGYFSKLWITYQSKADDTSGTATYDVTYVENAAIRAKHGGMHARLDLSSAGVLTRAQAQNAGLAVMKRYQNASFGGSFSIRQGQLLTMGGTPVDIGCEQAGFVCQLVLAAGPFGGEVSPHANVQFICGGYEVDDPAGMATVSPMQLEANDLNALLTDWTTMHPKGI
jgi:hypothetical protein